MGWQAGESKRAARAALVVVTLVATVCVPVAAGRLGRGPALAPTPGSYMVMLEQCTSANTPSERSATFTAQMVATAATQRMAMRIDLEQRMRGEAGYHTVSAPGLGVWRASEPGVKIYKYVKQVTNLAAPAVYRADVRFRWIGDKGKVIKRVELRSSRCFQPPLTPPLRPAAAG